MYAEKQMCVHEPFSFNLQFYCLFIQTIIVLEELKIWLPSGKYSASIENGEGMKRIKYRAQGTVGHMYRTQRDFCGSEGSI